MNQRHKHWYAIRAFADGWGIESSAFGLLWNGNKSPSFEENLKYRVVPDEEGWLPWYGGECPSEIDPVVRVEFRNEHGTHWACTAKNNPWDDTFMYRIVQEADPHAKLKAAAKDPTKQIRVKAASGTVFDWQDVGFDWAFNLPPERYEIRDKPKTKKVKFLAWFSGTAIHWRIEGAAEVESWKRIPSEDKEVEVEE